MTPPEIWAESRFPGTSETAQNRVIYVGAGPGAPDLLTRRGRDRLAAAGVVVADRPSLDDLLDRYAPVAAEQILVGRSRTQDAWPLDAVADLLADRHTAGRRVVRLKSGDLFVCSRAAEEIDALRARSVPVELVPGVSAAVAAPLAAGVALVPGGAGVATVVAGNDDPVYPPVDWPGLAGAGGTLVVLMGRAHQRAIAGHLVAAGRAPDTPVHLVHAATRAHQRIVSTTLAGLGDVRLPAPATAVIVDGGTPVHIPDGFIDLPTSAAAAAVAAPTVALATRRAGRQLVEREVPVAGLVVAYLVVAQLLVFPIGLGTGAHLLGTGLALVLVGPWLAHACVAVVLVLQALVLADGGITALGLNDVNNGLVPLLVGWAVLAAARPWWRDRPGARPVAAGLAAGAGVLAAAGAFCVEYAVGGTDALPVGTVTAGFLGAQAVVAVGEAALTGLLVAALVRVRPDLVLRWWPPRRPDRPGFLHATPDLARDGAGNRRLSAQFREERAR